MKNYTKIKRLIPDKLPPLWMAGFFHYHTAFSYPHSNSVTPIELQNEAKEVGGDFVICAGDHGGVIGNNEYPGWHTGKDYYDLVLSANREGEVLLLPSGEYHLWFPENNSLAQEPLYADPKEEYLKRHLLHHTLIPMLDWNDGVCKYVENNTTSKFIEEADKLKVPVVLNHPGRCYSAGQPDPLKIPWLGKMAYYEMFNTMEYYEYDKSAYKKFLEINESRAMGVVAGVDYGSHKNYGLSNTENIKNENVTYIYAPDGRSLKSLYKALQQRRTIAVRGSLFFEKLNHAPSINAYHVKEIPELIFSINNFNNKQIHKIEILKNGISCFKEIHNNAFVNTRFSDFSFKDNASYTICAEGDGDYLISSPIKFQRKY